MSDYGRNKIRTMLKSSLPASNRKEIKDRKDTLHRRNRRKPVVELTKYIGLNETDACELFEDDDFNYDYWDEPHREIHGGWSDIVYDRRDHDKLNHFIFWAWKRTRNLPVEDRESHFKKLLGPTMLGWHAMVHTMPTIRPELHDFYRWRNMDENGIVLPGRMQNHGDNERRRKREELQMQLLDKMRDIADDRTKRAQFNRFLESLSRTNTEKYDSMQKAREAANRLKRAGYEILSVEQHAWRAEWMVQYRLPLLKLHGKHDIYRLHGMICRQTKQHSWYGYKPYFYPSCEYFGLK